MISGIPLELTERVLTYAHPCDVASFAHTNSLARQVVYSPADDHLWRTLFLSHSFDDPRKSVAVDAGATPYPWRTQLCARIALEQRPASEERSWDAAAMDEAAKLVLGVMHEAPPAPEPSHNVAWLEQVLRRHRGLVPLPGAAQATQSEDDGEDRLLRRREKGAQACARLGAWLALAHEDLGPAALLQLGLFRLFRGDGGSEAGQIDPRVRAIRAARRAARARVYDLQRYRRENEYGPFLPSESGREVDWAHVHAQVAVVCMNVVDLAGDAGTDEEASHLRPPRGVRHLRPNSMPKAEGEDPRDWAGVQGQWRRLVCFMDYRDLMAYNLALQRSEVDARAHNPAYFDRPSFREATRLISMELTPTVFLGPDDCAPEDDPAHPPIMFVGRAFSSTMPIATMEGVVRRTRDGVVKWSWTHQMLHHDGHGWSSIGVQLGGVRSATGVVGTWTGAGHEDDDPAGPFWMWKVQPDSPKLFFDHT